MDQAAALTQDSRKRQTREEESEDSSSEDRWIKVEKRKRLKRNLETDQPTDVKPRLNKFKVLAANSAEAYRKICQMQEKRPDLKMTARPNLKSEWIINPLDEKTYQSLKTSTEITTQELKHEEKTKKAIVIGFPMDIPEITLTKHSQIIAAERMKNKEGILTKTILCTFTGKVPEKVDLGLWGKFATKTYYPEPLRCFNCQKYGHHKATCNSPPICAVCSSRHATAECIAKHKSGQDTSPKCPNCKNNHPAWHRRCPYRLNRIQATLPKEKAEDTQRQPRPANRIQASLPKDKADDNQRQPRPVPAPRTTFYTEEQLQKVRSLSRGRKPPIPLPRTIFLNTEAAKKEIMGFIDAVLISASLRAPKPTLAHLAEVLLQGLSELTSYPTSLFSPPMQPPTSSTPSSSSSSSSSSSLSTSSSSCYALPKALSTRTSPPPSLLPPQTSSQTSSAFTFSNPSSSNTAPSYSLTPNPCSNTDFPPLSTSSQFSHLLTIPTPHPPFTFTSNTSETPPLKHVQFQASVSRKGPRLNGKYNHG